jgi:twitching motility two-component system response regulator PilG
MDSRKPTIAVIDDSPTICKILTDVFRRQGYQVNCFFHPYDALRAFFSPAETVLPDVMCVDIELTQMDGLQLIKYIRGKCSERDIDRRVPIIIVISRRDGPIDRMKAFLAGANDYLAKPFLPHQALDLIEKYLPSSQTN